MGEETKSAGSALPSEMGLQLKTTGEILKDALDAGLITEADGNKLWQDMLRKRRRLGFVSFTEYLKQNS